MDRSEILAQAYLESLGCGLVAYEPDGQIPPDFALGDIAIEVRRLNRNYETAGGYEGLESAQASILRYVERLLPTFGPPRDGRAWWVFLTFWRPIDGRAIKRELPKALARFTAAPNPSGLDINITRTFELELWPASIPAAHQFMMGGYSDFDEGGFTTGEIIRNLNICIAEKVAKIRPYQHRYREWWLVLPNFISPNLASDECPAIHEHVDLQTFSRVVIIDPRKPTKALTLARPNTR